MHVNTNSKRVMARVDSEDESMPGRQMSKIFNLIRKQSYFIPKTSYFPLIFVSEGNKMGGCAEVKIII